MKRIAKIASVALVLAGLSGCISKKDYENLQTRFDSVYAENQRNKADLQAAQTRIAGLQEQLSSFDKRIADERANLKSLQDALDKCLNSSSTNITKLIDQIESSNKYIQRLVANKNRSDSLNMVLQNNLTRSLSREELKDVDVQVQKGVVFISLSDNMLYKSGSYEISPQAGDVLSKIAKIIKDYPDYDVLIEGNTDNVPISKPNIRNNWDLSALRASSVVQALQNDYGVNPKRMTAGGRGEFNPIASNDTEAGRTRNRRTQIIILPQLDQFMELIGKGPEVSK